jgi:hypothetical protein
MAYRGSPVRRYVGISNIWRTWRNHHAFPDRIYLFSLLDLAFARLERPGPGLLVYDGDYHRDIYSLRLNVTAFTPLNPVSFLIATTFFYIESAALLLALTHTYESLDATCRRRWKRKITEIKQVPGYTPMVSLHLPTYNEPLEVVEQTLRSLALLDYPNYEVLVVDNNTPNEKTWRPLEGICRQLGPNFHCLHLDQ